MDKEFIISKTTHLEFESMMKKREIDILNVEAMSVSELKALAKKLHLKQVADKSGKQISHEVNNLFKVYMAGQVSFDLLSNQKLCQINFLLCIISIS